MAHNLNFTNGKASMMYVGDAPWHKLGVKKYLLLTNSHDGKSLVRAKLTPVRVVCSNTLSSALEGAEQEVHIRHTPSAVDRLAEAHKILGLTNALYQELDLIFNRMNARRITERQLIEYVKTLVPDNEEASFNTRTENIRSKTRVE